MSSIVIPLWVALGGAIGSLGRYWCSGLVARWVGETFPFGTMFVNVVGSFLIAVVFTVTGPDGRMLLGTGPRQFMLVGVFGGFTTFSSFSLQTLTLMQDGEWLWGAANVVLSVLLCIFGAWLGHSLAVTINR